MNRPTGLIDREAEIAEMQALLATGSPQLALLTGRRRVGKTYLVSNGWPAGQLFLFTASRTTDQLNREQLIRDLAGWSGQDLHVEDYPTWRTVFNLLLEMRSPDPIVIVLDEFQYLSDSAEGAAAIASELNASWERRRSARQMVLVLAGSGMSVLESLAKGGGPLYGRFAWQRRLLPFDYWYSAELAPLAKPRDRALIYGIMGGTPRYLAAVDTSQSLADNVSRLMLAPTGVVRLLVETALDQEEGLREQSKYRAVLRAVASGCTQRNEIAQRTGLENDAALRDKLARLMDLGYVEIRANIDAKSNEPARYAIADPAFCFHERFVEPARSMLERYAAEQVWQSAVAPHLDTYMGREFERMAQEAYDRRAPAHGLPLVKSWGRWEGQDRDRKSLEIDLLAPLEDGRILSGAVKWNRAPVTARVHYTHMEMLRRAAEAGRSWAHAALEADAPLYYVAAAGFSAEFREAASSSGHPVTCWSLNDLYAA